MNIYVILSIVILIIVFYKLHYIESFTADEALQNISSLYNNQNMIVSNLNVTGNSKLGNTSANSLNVSGNTTLGNTSATSLKLSGALGSESGIVFGTYKKESYCNNKIPTGKTHTDLYNEDSPCNHMCPPNTYMVGIKYGEDEQKELRPICRTFN